MKNLLRASLSAQSTTDPRDIEQGSRRQVAGGEKRGQARPRGRLLTAIHADVKGSAINRRTEHMQHGIVTRRAKWRRDDNLVSPVEEARKPNAAKRNEPEEVRQIDARREVDEAAKVQDLVNVMGAVPRRRYSARRANACATMRNAYRSRPSHASPGVHVLRRTCTWSTIGKVAMIEILRRLGEIARS